MSSYTDGDAIDGADCVVEAAGGDTTVLCASAACIGGDNGRRLRVSPLSELRVTVSRRFATL